MTSMLDALRQIEARQPAVRPAGSSRPEAEESPAAVEEISAAIEETCAVVEEPAAAPEVVPPEPVDRPEDDPPISSSGEAPEAEETTRVDTCATAWDKPCGAPQEGTASAKQWHTEESSTAGAGPTGPPPIRVGDGQAAPATHVSEAGWDLAKLLARPVPPRDRPYRDLSANILSQLEPGHPAAILFVTPAGSRRKTANFVRLAAVLAGEVPAGALAVDVDLRSPALAEAFGFDPERGLADVLLGVANWQELVLPTDSEGLWVLPGRPFPAARVPALTPVRLARLLDDLRRHYGLVLLDAGQSAPNEVALWARFCDGTYLVAGLGETTSRAASQAAELLGQAAGRVLGMVLTQAAED